MLWLAAYIAIGAGLFFYSAGVGGSARWRTKEALCVSAFWPFVLSLAAYDALRYHLRKQ
jgi:hypothetical protein